MRRDYYPKLNQAVVSHTLSNGMKLFVYEKPGFNRCFAMLGVNYGSIDARFVIDGKRFSPPAGIAHFLEHKVFEQPDGGNALRVFAQNGASPNAFTSKCLTAYHFSATEKFFKNLEVLLSFVTTPYFTDENVEKERGIIQQEISMTRDNPRFRLFEETMKGLYSVYPARESVIGTAESIEKIDREVLLKCYNAFYVPSNMTLTAVGNIDAARVIETAEGMLEIGIQRTPRRNYPDETAATGNSEKIINMDVAGSLISIAYRTSMTTVGKKGLRLYAAALTALELLIGRSSMFYEELYRDGIIGNDFSDDLMIMPGSVCVIFSGTCRDANYFVREFASFADTMKMNIDETKLRRAKKCVIGALMRTLDSPAALAREQTQCAFRDYNYLDLIDTVEEISHIDVSRFIVRLISNSNITKVIIESEQGGKE